MKIPEDKLFDDIVDKRYSFILGNEFIHDNGVFFTKYFLMF